MSVPNTKARGGLNLVYASFDGFLYVAEGQTGCVSSWDLGEHVYGMPLLEDIDSDGLMDLVVATMNGNVMALRTRVPYNPARSWLQQVRTALLPCA